MRALLIFGGSLAAIFASTFLILAIFGGFGADNARDLVESVSKIDKVWVAVLVICLLFADLFVAMPTLTLCILAGYYLGPWVGGGSASCGMLLAGICGYGLSYRFGTNLLNRICRDEKNLLSTMDLFSRRGPAVLLLCRASPMLPEVSSCLAGAARMKFSRYLMFYGIASIPYAFIAAQAGSVSSLDDPMPAIFVAIGITAVLWLVWWRMARRWKREAVSAL